MPRRPAARHRKAGSTLVTGALFAGVVACSSPSQSPSDGDDSAPATGGTSGSGGASSTGGSAGKTGGTGGSMNPPDSVPGVVVVDRTAGTTTCYPLCVVNTDPAADPEGDDFSWEDNRSCVIPGTLTGSNQPCMTGEPIPPPEPRPGILVSVSGADAECVPVCRIATLPTSANSDWSYENNESCVLPNTPTAEGRRQCTFGVAPVYVPPALTGQKVADGFYTEGGRLRDAYGNDFVIRGVNNAHAWFDGYAEFDAYLALDDIESYGTNTVRIVWETTASPKLLADVLFRIVELGMVPMLELHDVTGIRDAGRLVATAEYYTREDVLPVLQDFRAYLLINVANEWSGGADYLSTYQTVIGSLRSAGIEHALVIDASGFGQNAQSLFDNFAAMTESDPEHNLVFSIHMYDLYADPAEVDRVLERAVADGIPFIVGEFGQELSGTSVAWQRIMQRANELELGTIAWSWMGNNADTAQLDMAEDWEGPLTTWGEDVMGGADGITATSRKASIFE